MPINFGIDVRCQIRKWRVSGERVLRWCNVGGRCACRVPAPEMRGRLRWKTARFERLSIATGPPPTRTTSRRSIGFTERTQCSSIRNRGSAIRGRHNIQASRFAQPNKKRFTVRRILGAADLWITKFVLTYDGQPSYTVSIMEFRDGKVARETQYFGDPFEPGPSRVQWVERMR